MADMLEILKTFGIGTAAFVAIGLFFWRAFWPFLQRQVEAEREQRQVERSAFLQALSELQATQREISGSLSRVARGMETVVEVVNPKKARRRAK